MLNFNTNTGKPIYLDNESEPSFYIDSGDLKFIEKTHSLYGKLKQYIEQSKKRTIEIEKDENGVPINSAEFVEIMKEEYDMILQSIDELLGEGVSSKVFKGRYNQELLTKFIDFLVEAISKDRQEYAKKYLKKENKGVL